MGFWGGLRDGELFEDYRGRYDFAVAPASASTYNYNVSLDLGAPSNVLPVSLSPEISSQIAMMDAPLIRRRLSLTPLRVPGARS